MAAVAAEAVPVVALVVQEEVRVVPVAVLVVREEVRVAPVVSMVALICRRTDRPCIADLDTITAGAVAWAV